MNRLTRITAILVHLQSKSVVTAKEMATRYDVSLRTIYRDIQTLQEAGVPIGSENGIGYFIVDGFNLPPISITEDEANALITSEQFIQNQGDSSLTENFESFVLKIKSTLKNFQKDQVDILEERIGTFVKGTVSKSSWLSTIQNAITNRSVLRIFYNALHDDKRTERDIEPLAVYFTNNNWIVIAHCQLRSDLREFRLDRIEQIIVTPSKFAPHHNFQLQQYFLRYEDS